MTLLISGNIIREIQTAANGNGNNVTVGQATGGGTTNVTIQEQRSGEIHGNRGITIQDNRDVASACPDHQDVATCLATRS